MPHDQTTGIPPLKHALTRLLLILAIIAALPAAAESAGKPEAAPDIDIRTAQREFRLSSLRGNVIYLDFWASWCTPCRESFPWMNRMEQKYSARGFKIIAINLDEDRSRAEVFLKKYPARFTIGFDAAGKSAEIFDVRGMPSSYLIDRQGKLITRHIGFRQKDTAGLESAIRSALNRQESK
ncbi:MAG TPA: TlpA family protein disulfide reductase [Gammaproteobacteria bacterium]|nr:TlpA family protein disulfide reductase [Gammaproteobacteria bacterium]